MRATAAMTMMAAVPARSEWVPITAHRTRPTDQHAAALLAEQLREQGKNPKEKEAIKDAGPASAGILEPADVAKGSCQARLWPRLCSVRGTTSHSRRTARTA